MAAQKQSDHYDLYHIHAEPWTISGQGAGVDSVNYKIDRVLNGNIIKASEYKNLMTLINKETKRRGNGQSGSVGSTVGDFIYHDDYNTLINTLINFRTQCFDGLQGETYVFRGNGHRTLPNYSALQSGAPGYNDHVAGINPPVAQKKTAADLPSAHDGNIINAEIGIAASRAFNILIDALIFAGQQCFCNCNFCSCNCNFCTCNCNFACTCNCNYSDENTKTNIIYI